MCGNSKNGFSKRLGSLAGYCWLRATATALVMATVLVALVMVPVALAARAMGMGRAWPRAERLLVATERALLAVKGKATTKPLPLPPLRYSPEKEPWTASGPKD